MKIDILNIQINHVTLHEARNILQSCLKSKEARSVFTPNAEICMMALKNPQLMRILNHGFLVVPDGQGVVLASRILKQPLRERVAGCDLVTALLESGYPLSVYLLGGKPGVAERAAQNIGKAYPHVRVAGFHHGYFEERETPGILEKINASESDLLLVGLGAPRQEYWISRNLTDLEVSVAMGVGGTLDILAGETVRAPDFFLRNGLEWFYRLIKQPRRFFRMCRIPAFLFRCICRRIRLIVTKAS